jgi:hypothetical protein
VFKAAAAQIPKKARTVTALPRPSEIWLTIAPTIAAPINERKMTRKDRRACQFKARPAEWLFAVVVGNVDWHKLPLRRLLAAHGEVRLDDHAEGRISLNVW